MDYQDGIIVINSTEQTTPASIAEALRPENGALVDLRPTADTLEDEILRGLQRPVKTLPTKLLYDQRGSELFDEITELAEYYPTRTETSILQQNIAEIAESVGPDAQLIEFGSGSSIKTRILLDALPEIASYVPVDISAKHLAKAAERLRKAYPKTPILPVTADYMQPIELPATSTIPSRRVAFFPGSTIGNFQPDEALAFLQRVAKLCGAGESRLNGGLLIGVDLKKDPNRLHQAYNDAEGVTAAFNLNILSHLNSEFATGFRVDQFRHYAYYNAQHGRIEMHLVNLADQQIEWQERQISLRQGESIWTESSYKYTVAEFHDLVAKAGFTPKRTWLDHEELFSVHFLEVN